MEPPEIIDVNPGDEISCNGGKTYGHPRVYLTLSDDGFADCYYCGRRFQVVGTGQTDDAEPERQGAT